jgi:molybdate transport system permease protein
VLLLVVGLPILSLLPGISLDSLAAQISERGLLRAVGVSLGSATLATALAAVLGIPTAYLLAHSESRVSWLTRGLLVLPTVLPPVAAGVLLLNVFGPAGPVGALLSAGGWTFVNAFGGIVIAQLFVTTPFVVLTAEAAFRSLDPVLEEASQTLGQGTGRTFRRVALPLARYGILAGLALGWMRALGEFGATVVMAYHPHSLPVYLWLELTGRGLQSALPVALVALVIAVLTLVMAEPLARSGMARSRGASPGLRGPTRPAAAEAHAPRGLPSETPSSAGMEPLAESVAVAGHRAVAGSARETRSASETLLAADIGYVIGGFRMQLELTAGREIVSLFGPSGAGKSTLLRLLAGLGRPERGRIVLGGVVCFAGEAGRTDGDAVAADRRPAGMVFQEPALFPHLDVARNVLYGVERVVQDPEGLLAELTATTRLQGLERRFPHELSGGQQQRVALARALARRPRVLLLDEPFSSLDFNMKERLHRDVRRIQRTYGLCVLYVTHDLRDACALGDRLAVISDGRLLQTGPPLEVLRRPANFDVARFVAVRNLLPGVVEASGSRGGLVRCGGISLATGPVPFITGDAVYACIRPEDVVLLKPDRPLAPPADENVLAGGVLSEQLRGPTYSLTLCVESAAEGQGPILEIELPVRSYDSLGIGARKEWRVSLRKSAIHLVAR